MKAKTLTVTVSKTTQIVQYEPLAVTLTETYDLAPGENLRTGRAKAIRSLGATLRKEMISLENRLKDDEDSAE